MRRRKNEGRTALRLLLWAVLGFCVLLSESAMNTQQAAAKLAGFFRPLSLSASEHVHFPEITLWKTVSGGETKVFKSASESGAEKLLLPEMTLRLLGSREQMDCFRASAGALYETLFLFSDLSRCPDNEARARAAGALPETAALLSLARRLFPEGSAPAVRGVADLLARCAAGLESVSLGGAKAAEESFSSLALSLQAFWESIG